MPIKFCCPNEGCGKALTVSDGAAGRTGKCPSCGGTLVVPRPEPAEQDIPYEMDLEPEPVARPRAIPKPASSRPADDLDWAPFGAEGADGPVVSFDVIGLAWDLLKLRMGTWVVAVLVVGLAQFGCQVVLTVLSIFATAGEAAVISSPVPLSSLAVLALGMMIHGVLIGGLYKMALKQVDGGDISVGDLFSIGPVAPGLALSGFLVGLGTFFGFLCFIFPGILFAGLMMFAEPAVVEGVGAVEAIKRSLGTLRRQWLLAPLFLVVLWLILMAGGMFFGVGVLFTAPLCVLAVSVQYRRSFAPGGVARKSVVADPWAEAAGKPDLATRSGGMPVWAWGVLGIGIVVPLVLVSMVVAALVIPAARKAAQVAAERDRRAKFQVELRGQGDLAGAPQPVGDPVERALDASKPRRDKKPFDLASLANLPPDDHHRAKVVAALTPLLSDPDFAEDAAQALAHWATRDEVPTLVSGLDSDVPRVRWLMFDAIRRLKASAAIPALVEHMAVLEDRAQASNALEAIGPEAAPAVQKLLASDDLAVRRQASAVLRRIGGNDQGLKLSSTLATLASPDAQERTRALGDLGRMPVVDASRDEVLAATLPLLKDANPSARRDALKVVEAWGTTEQLPALIEALDDPDRTVKLAAIAALRKTPDPRSALAFARLLAVKETAVRQRATDALVAMKPEDDEVELEVLKVLDNPDAPARQAACQVLKAIGTEASLPALKKVGGDTNKNVATAARAAIEAIDPSAKPTDPPDMPKSKTTIRKKR